MTTKQRLHQLIDSLPETAVADAERYLESLAPQTDVYERTAEDRAWMDSDLSRLGDYEPYDWGPEGPLAGRPVRYIPGVGIVIEE